ncbi:MAG TPA: NADH-quinone oxidoreductase subunit L [Acidiferrobacterales bacterium]|nr:NADH-quinone oxidoreductase subunit L [Acidiferrobacterales bacterium]
MFENMQNVYLATPLVCLAGALLAGLFGKVIGRAGAHTAAILGVGMAFALSLLVFNDTVLKGHVFNGTVFTWGVSGGIPMEIGFLIDPLSAMMMVVVTFVSLMVHIYTIGYMHDDPGYQRFFSYIALFTFAMLMLVMSNNFLQLFFGWEAVGLVSYLLIGFWYTRESAIFANLKAFIVNRVGDFGFLLGIAAIYYHFGSLDYAAVFAIAPQHVATTVQIFPGVNWMLMTVICILLFIGAMGKSAQVPLHVWLPDSMEGPTPISALIHAATMVTAGILMVARMSPLFELSETALSVILVIGAITALFMGFLGIVQNDIKRVIAYSTLSQLGYMTVALGASAYAAGIFHLMTHAFFKALLFLGAGSVIIAMHHEQDLRKMGGLKKYMPFTFITAWVGTLALTGIPPFAGFFSKDAIIEAVHHSQLPGAGFAYIAVLAGVFVTALYSFRLMFLAFYGKPRMDEHTRKHLHESPAVVVTPLILLAIPSVVAGWIYIEPMLFGNFFGDAIKVLPQHNVLAHIRFDGIGPFIAHGLQSAPFILAVLGFGLAWLLYLHEPKWPDIIRDRIKPIYNLLVRKYGFDEFNQRVFAGGARGLGGMLWRIGDVKIIDGLAVNGTARAIGWLSSVVRHVQSGYIYHYAFAMIIGLFLLMTFFLHR